MTVTAQQLVERMPDARDLLSDEPEADGTLVLGPAETALREQHRADQERQRAEHLAQRLRALGVDLED
jgi:hypothetical protein